MKINGSNEIKNDKELNQQKTNEIQHDNKFVRDVDFSKMPNLAEMLGRSMINFAAKSENAAPKDEQSEIMADRELKNRFNEICKKLNLGAEISVGELKVLFNSVNCSKEDILAKLEVLEMIAEKQPEIAKNRAILSAVTQENSENFKILISDENVDLKSLSTLAKLVMKDNLPQIKELLQASGLNLERAAHSNAVDENNIDIIKQIANRDDISLQNYIYITNSTTKTNKDLAAKLLQNENIEPEHAVGVLWQTMFETDKNIELKKQFVEELLADSDFKMSKMGYLGGKLLAFVNSVNYDIAMKIYKDHESGFYFVGDFLKSIDEENKAVAMKIVENMPADYDFKLQISPNTEKYLDLIEKFKGTDDYKTLFEGHFVENADMKEVEAVLNSEKYPASTKMKIIHALESNVSKEQAESFITELEKYGRFQDSSQDVANLCAFASVNEISEDFFRKIVANERFSDSDVYNLMEASLKISDNGDFDEEDAKTFFNSILSSESLPVKSIISAMGNANFNNLEITKYILEKNTQNDEQLSFSEYLTDNDMNIFEKFENIQGLPKNLYSNLVFQFRDSNSRRTSEVLEKKYQALEYVMKNSGNCNFENKKTIENLKTLLYEVEKEPDFVDFMLKNNISATLMLKAVEERFDGADSEFLKNVLSNENLSEDDKKLLISNAESEYAVKSYEKDPNLTLKFLKSGVSSYYVPETIVMYKKNPEITQKFIDSGLNNGEIREFNELDDKIKENILAGIEKAKKDYNIDLKGGSFVENKFNGDDSFIFIEFPNELGVTNLKFDKDTGELVAVASLDYCINVKNNTRIDSVKKTEGIEFGDLNDPFSGGVVQSPYYMENIISNTDGTPARSLIYAQGETNGEFDIYDVTPQGKRFKIGFAEFDNFGGKHIEKTLTSLDGTKTDHVYADDANGNRFIYQKITDKSGKVLFESKKQFKVLSENHFVTSTDNNHFDVQISDDKVVISKLDENKKPTGETVQYKIADFSDEEYENLYNSLFSRDIDDSFEVKKWLDEQKIDFVIDRKVLPALKQFSGEEWLNMYNSGTKLVLGGYTLKKDNACSCGGAILVSEKHYSGADTIAHELGHEKFHYLKLHEDKELRKIYEEEKKLFTATFPDVNIDSISYFLADNNEEIPRGLNETVAESNLIMNVPQSWEITRDRTLVLQHYFPKTFAYIANKIQTV